MAYVIGKIHGKIYNQGIHILLTGANKISESDTEKTQEK